MTKQEVFPMYVGKCKVETPNGINEYWACDLGTEMVEHTKSNKHGIASNISDCQLILKRLSKMRGSDDIFYRALLLDVAMKSGSDPQERLQQSINNVQNFLISHGYALDDSWFDGKEPIATENDGSEK